jgi:DUF971 family protein
MEYVLKISFHFPHDRFALGWEYIKPDAIDNYHTFTLYLFIATLSLDVSSDVEC